MGWQVIAVLLFSASLALAQAGRIYTAPEPSATGGIVGIVPVEGLTHVLAIDQERVKVFRGSSSGGQFRLEHLPVGKYDVVLVTNGRGVYEGLRLGDEIQSMPTGLRTNLEKRIALADSFFNRYKVHRCGVDGERVLVLVERIRDRLILQQSGEKLDANLRRLEVIELEQATDDWQMIQSRHLYREGEPIEKSPPFLKHAFVAGLSSIRVVDSVKELGTVTLPKD
ncbi:MAG: hypothetical protein WCS70_03820 [Verrucomicrobiota bacterium]